MRHFINAAGTVATIVKRPDHYRINVGSASFPYATETDALNELAGQGFREYSTAGGYAAL